VTQAWLEGHGLSRRDAAKHAERGNLLRIGAGAYARPGDKLTWESGVFGLQYGEKPPKLSFWAGGVTALSLAGYSHYLALRRDRLQLFGRPRVRLSKWFDEHDWAVDLEVNRAALFKSDEDRVFESYTPPGRDYQIHVSSPEMAILEWLYVMPNPLLFGDFLVDTFAGLTTLRPRRLQQLLESCSSVRVKRVFLLLARYAGHSWYSRLDTSTIDLGKGKRQLTIGGKLDKEYQITVPERFIHGD
jgi:hypothetical protein